MSNGWIVTSYQFALHGSVEDAFGEADRLTELTGKRFRVMRIKNADVPRPKVSDVPPIHEIVSIKYNDADGNEQTFCAEA